MAITTRTVTSTVSTGQSISRGVETVLSVPAGSQVLISIAGTDTYKQNVPEHKVWDVTTTIIIRERDV